MSKIIVLYLFIVTGLVFGQENQPLETVKNVNIEKYIGTWFEIARIPNSFQDDCTKNTTATYTFGEDNEIIVQNKCIEEDGDYDIADGVARIVDTLSNAKLEVSFFSILGFRPIWGDYWIIGLDEDYNWAIVGHPERKYGWILCRNKSLSLEEERKVDKILEDQGYKKDDFVKTVQK